MLKYFIPLFFSFMSIAIAAKPMQLNPAQEALLSKIQGFLNGIHTMRAKFVQVTDRETRNGTFKWLRPHHLRFDYTGAPQLQLSCDGDYFKQKDADGITEYEVWRTPASLLLKPSLDFKNDAHIKSLAEVAGMIMLEVAQKDDPDGPTLTLIFRPQPFSLVQWRMLDASGNITDVILADIEAGISLDKKEFQLK